MCDLPKKTIFSKIATLDGQSHAGNTIGLERSLAVPTLNRPVSVYSMAVRVRFVSVL